MRLVALTVFIDSYFWSTFPLWPELHGLYFNVYQGKSADWGVCRFHKFNVVFSLGDRSLPRLLT